MSQQNVPEVTQKAKELEQRRLDYYTLKANQEQEEERQEKNFFNMSLKEIFTKWSRTLISIITEYTNLLQESFQNKKFPELSRIVDIIFREDRMIYIGLTLIFLTLSIYFIDVTS